MCALSAWLLLCLLHLSVKARSLFNSQRLGSIVTSPGFLWTLSFSYFWGSEMCYLPHLSAGQLQFFCCCLFNPQWEIGPQPTHTKPSYPLQLLPCSLHTVDLCLLHSRLHVFLRSLYISFLLRVPMKWLASYALSRFSPCVPSPAPTTLNFHKSEASARPEAAGVSTVTQKSAALPAPVLTVNGHESHAWVLWRDSSDQMCERNHKVSFSLKCCNVLMKHSSIALFKSATESFRDVLLLL